MNATTWPSGKRIKSRYITSPPMSIGHGQMSMTYSREFAKKEYQGRYRQNGEPIFDNHIVPVVKLFSKLLINPKFRNIGISMAYLHDIVEDNKDKIKICHPKEIVGLCEVEKLKYNQYLNSHFNRRDNGKEICYGVWRLTKNIGYQDEYWNRITSVNENDEDILILDLISSLVKLPDIYVNSDPDERYRLCLIDEKKFTEEMFLGKKVRNGLERFFIDLPRLERIMLAEEFRYLKLFNIEDTKKVFFETYDRILEFFRTHDAYEILRKNNSEIKITRADLDVNFYTNSLKRLKEFDTKLVSKIPKLIGKV